MPSTKPLVTFVADQEWIDKVDDFRFRERLPSRAATIKWLVDQALEKGLKPSREPPAE